MLTDRKHILVRKWSNRELRKITPFFDVRRAFANLCSMSRDVVIVVVPFSQVQHESESYGDYWRFTPTCLRELFRENGMTVIYEAESPHRRASIYLLFAASRHPKGHIARMPRHRRITAAGNWIGASLAVSGIQFTTHRVGRFLERYRTRKA